MRTKKLLQCEIQAKELLPAFTNKLELKSLNQEALPWKRKRLSSSSFRLESRLEVLAKTCRPTFDRKPSNCGTVSLTVCRLLVDASDSLLIAFLIVRDAPKSISVTFSRLWIGRLFLVSIVRRLFAAPSGLCSTATLERGARQQDSEISQRSLTAIGCIVLSAITQIVAGHMAGNLIQLDEFNEKNSTGRSFQVVRSAIREKKFQGRDLLAESVWQVLDGKCWTASSSGIRLFHPVPAFLWVAVDSSGIHWTRFMIWTFTKQKPINMIGFSSVW